MARALDETGVDWLVAQIKSSLSVDVEEDEDSLTIKQGTWSKQVGIGLTASYDREAKTLNLTGGSNGRTSPGNPNDN